MAFIPHNASDQKKMLEAIGESHLESLFDDCGLPQEPFGDRRALSEQEITHLMKERAHLDREQLCFIGAGAYEHFIPAAVWQVASRGEYLTAYTPYQGEASQGMLQTIFEFQTMMANLLAMDVANASMYEGGSALAEAVLMAVRLQKKSGQRTVLIAGTLSPTEMKVIDTVCGQQDIKVLNLDQAPTTIDPAAVIIAQPTFLGDIQQVDELTDWAHQLGSLVIAKVNPMAMAILKPPGEWGACGADICCGEAQPFGIPLSSGGPYLGFMATRMANIRQMPGRLVGATTDLRQNPCYTLTLQAREQHIRRAKATSNICTNQGLMMVAATLYLSLMGPLGLKSVALSSHHNAVALQKKLSCIPGVKIISDKPIFNEFIVELPVDASSLLAALSDLDIQAGYALGIHFSERKNQLLICSTEIHSAQDQQRLVDAMSHHVAQFSGQSMTQHKGRIDVNF